MAEQSEMTLPSSENSTFTPSSHKLHDTWNLWAHLPHDTSWNLESYRGGVIQDYWNLVFVLV